jgi:hypothetical protein
VTWRAISPCCAGSVVAFGIVLLYLRGYGHMAFYKKGKSLKRKEFEILLQESIEYLVKRVRRLKRKVERVIEAIKQGRLAEFKEETDEKQDFKNQVENNKSGLSNSPPEKLNGNDSEMDAHQVDMFEDCVVTVDVHREDIKEGKDELEQIGKNDSVDENVLGCVEGVNGQEDKLEQIGEAECVEETVLAHVESVNKQEKEIVQIGEAKCVEETVLVHEEGLQGENSGMEAETQSYLGKFKRRIRQFAIYVWHRGKFKRRIRNFGISVLCCYTATSCWLWYLGMFILTMIIIGL